MSSSCCYHLQFVESFSQLLLKHNLPLESLIHITVFGSISAKLALFRDSMALFHLEDGLTFVSCSLHACDKRDTNEFFIRKNLHGLSLPRRSSFLLLCLYDSNWEQNIPFSHLLTYAARHCRNSVIYFRTAYWDERHQPPLFKCHKTDSSTPFSPGFYTSSELVSSSRPPARGFRRHQVHLEQSWSFFFYCLDVSVNENAFSGYCCCCDVKWVRWQLGLIVVYS